MGLTVLMELSRWVIVLPPRQLTPTHLTIVDRRPDQTLDAAAAASLIDAYRRLLAALQYTDRCDGFAVSFAVGWQPDSAAIGEPDSIAGARRAIHVFGRHRDQRTSPVRVMAEPRDQRRYADMPLDKIDALRSALVDAPLAQVPGPNGDDCDGCAVEVLTLQERWRAEGVRVIRPHHLMIDPQVLILPLRHVVSLGDLEADEVVSIIDRLGEVLSQFGQTSGVTGLSCFANDGVAARQETPHVHLHVYGRSADEPVNPFELLKRRLTQR